MQSDMNIWPFKVLSSPWDKPMIEVNFKGREEAILNKTSMLKEQHVNMRDYEKMSKVHTNLNIIRSRR